MKLLTAIKKAQKKSSERYGEVTFNIRRKYGTEGLTSAYSHISVNLEVRIDGYFEVEDLMANDWIIEKDY